MILNEYLSTISMGGVATMKFSLSKMLTAALAVAVMSMSSDSVNADLTVGVGESTSPWLGFMNVFELNANPNTLDPDAPSGDPNNPYSGGFVFGSGWGVSDTLSIQYKPELRSANR